MNPLCIDLFTGLHGWAEGFLAEGWCAIGVDIEDMCEKFGFERPEGITLLLRDVRSITGLELVREYGAPEAIVASPPCQEFSYMAMPWSKAKAKQAAILASKEEQTRLTDLFNQCFRIQREVNEAVGHYVPMVVENVRGAQKWVGKARWHFGSYYLWGDVPALMPIEKVFKSSGMNWSDQTIRGQDFTRIAGQQADLKLPGNNSARRWEDRLVARLCDAGNKIPVLNVVRTDKTRSAALANYDQFWVGIKQGGDWFNQSQPSISRTTGSKSKARLLAAAMIARIPFPLSNWIAKCFHPARTPGLPL